MKTRVLLVAPKKCTRFKKFCLFLLECIGYERISYDVNDPLSSIARAIEALDNQKTTPELEADGVIVDVGEGFYRRNSNDVLEKLGALLPAFEIKEAEPRKYKERGPSDLINEQSRRYSVFLRLILR